MTRISLLLLLIPSVCLAQAEQDQKWTGDIAMKALGSDKGGAGIDYKFRFEPFKASDAGLSGGLTGSGSITTDSTKNTANAVSLAATLDFEKEFAMPAGWTTTTSQAGEGGGRPSAGSILSVPGSFRLSAVGKGEATQDMNNRTVSVGPLVAVDLPWWGPLMHFAGLKSRPLFLSAEYNFLRSRKYDAAAKARLLDKLTDKITYEAGTLLFVAEKEIEITYRADYQVKMPIPAADVPQWADFVAIRLGLFDLDGVGIKAGKFSIIYSTGRLAPVYERGHAIGGGVYLKF